MKKSYLVVNRHKIRANKYLPPEERHPPLRYSDGKHGTPTYHNEYHIDNLTRLVYRPDDPMPCGATVYFEIDRPDGR